MNKNIIFLTIYLLIFTLTILSIYIIIFQGMIVDREYDISNIDLDRVPKYIINLERRDDRLNVTKGMLNQFGYKDIIRYPAVDGMKIPEEQLIRLVHPESMEPIYKKIRTEHHQLSLGAVGCYLSHINLWDELEKSKHDYAVIFEDDTKPSLSKNDLENILSKCPKDWDVILFGGFYNIKDENIFKNNHFYKVNQFFCLHAYMINKRAIKKIKPNLYPIKVQIDWVLSDLSKEGKLNVYAIKNSKWYQNDNVNSTDIQTPVVVNK